MKLVSVHKQALMVLAFLWGYQGANAQTWSLQQCIDTAQVHNKSLQISRNNIEIGEQKTKEANANLNPKITANTDYKYFTNLPYQLMPLSTFNPAAPEGQFKEAQFGVPHNINANLQLTMPLYNPQLYGAIQTTKIAGELTKLQYQKTEEQIYFEISNLYYNAQILAYQLSFIDSNLLNAKLLLKNTELLRKQLLARGTDVAKVQLQVSQLSTQQETVSNKLIQVLNGLKFAMGISIDHIFIIEKNVRLQEGDEYESNSSLDILIAKTQNQLLLNDLATLNKSQILPSVSLIGSYGTAGFGYDKQPNTFLKFYPIGFAGVQVSYPLFNGTVTQKKISQKKLEIQNNELQFELLTEQNKLQVENAKLQRIMARKSAETVIEQIELAKSIYDQTLLLQKQDMASLSDVLLADNALREAQQTYLAAIVDFLKADLELKKLSGNLFQLRIKN